MVAGFIATDAYAGEEEDFIITGVAAAASQPPQYLNFQRSTTVGGDDHEGVHIEYNDQINSGYEKVKRCSLQRDRLRVELTEPIDWENKYSGFEIELRLSGGAWDSLALGLRKVFTGREDLLNIEK